MFLDTLLSSGTIVVVIVLSFIPVLDTLSSTGVGIPKGLIDELSQVGYVYLLFAVLTSIALYLEYYVSFPIAARLYPFVDAVALVLFLYLIYCIVTLFPKLTKRKPDGQSSPASETKGP